MEAPPLSPVINIGSVDVIISRSCQLLTGTPPDALNLHHVLMTDPAVEPGSLGRVAALGDEQTDGVGANFLVLRVQPDISPLVFSVLHGDENQVQPHIADLSNLLGKYSGK